MFIMNYRKLFYISMLFICTACSTQKKNTATVSADTSSVSLGLSYNTAILINETSETSGVNAEYAWLKSKYPGYKTKSQTLVTHDKQPFDVITIITQSGEELKVYFNISNFFGKL